MSDFRVPITTIKEVFPHPNATALEFVKCYDFNIIVSKGRYKVGDKVVFVPPDSVLPQDIADQMFPSGSKIKLHKNRIKQIKIRGEYSQGLIIAQGDLTTHSIDDNIPLETDVAGFLSITKYQPGPSPFEGSGGKTKRDKPKENPLFHQYNGIENIKWYPELFKEGEEEVVIQEKLHGSNCRASILPYSPNTLLKKIKKFLGFAPEFEYCYGSNMVQLQERKNYKGFYGDNVYGKVLEKVNAFSKIKPGETIYGELIGEGIQKNYNYGHTREHHFVLFDVKVLQPDGTQKWLNPEEVAQFAKGRGFDFVPILYVGTFNKALAYELTKGASKYHPETKVMEGIVIKSRTSYNDDRMSSNKRALKWLSEKYLDKDNTEYH
jgi:RNA ligase (TIGR02306 family)